VSDRKVFSDRSQLPGLAGEEKLSAFVRQISNNKAIPGILRVLGLLAVLAFRSAHGRSSSVTCLSMGQRRHDSGGLELVGIDSFAPNDLSLHLFTVWPFNE
jgi:hypothetical protein